MCEVLNSFALLRLIYQADHCDVPATTLATVDGMVWKVVNMTTSCTIDVQWATLFMEQRRRVGHHEDGKTYLFYTSKTDALAFQVSRLLDETNHGQDSGTV